MNDHDLGIEQHVATADECPYVLIVSGGFDDPILLKRRHLMVRNISSLKEPPDTISVASASP